MPNVCTIGSQWDADLRHAGLLMQHAELRFELGDWVICRMNPKAVMSFHGHSVDMKKLNDGDWLDLGGIAAMYAGRTGNARISVAGWLIILTSAVFWLVLVIFLQTAFALSVSLILSCLYLYLRDIEHIYQVFLRLLFFLTPIFYTMDFIGDGFVRNIVMLNPLTHLTMFARNAILGGDSIVVEMTASLLLVSVMLLLALFVFRKFEPFIAERV